MIIGLYVGCKGATIARLVAACTKYWVLPSEIAAGLK